MKTRLLLILTVLLANSCLIRRVPGYDAPVELLHVEGNESRIMKQMGTECDSLPQIYIAVAEDLKRLEEQSDKQYQVLFIGAHYCQGADEILSEVTAYTSLHNEYFDLFPLFVNREGNAGKIYDYLKQKKYYHPVFILDLEWYSPSLFCSELRMSTKVVKELYPKYNDESIGTGDFVVIKEGEILFQTTMDDNMEESVGKLKDLPLAIKI